MASVNATSLANRLIETLGSSWMMEIRLYIGFHEELVELNNALSTIRAVTADAEKKARSHPQVRVWIQRVQDSLLEADDFVDELRTEILRNRLLMRRNRVITKLCVSCPISFNHLVFRRKLIYLNEKIDAIGKDKYHFMLHRRPYELEIPASLRDRARNRQSLEIAEDKIVGREGDLKEIVSLLVDLQSEENVSVASVVGMGGLGKTVLAKLAFDHAKVVKHFGSVRIWVDVSGAFDEVRIAASILKSVTGRSALSKDAENIELIIEKELAGRKFLLVLDDVRSIDREKWLDFKRLLMSGAEGSRVLLTTRSRDTASMAGTMAPLYLQPLSEENSWILFKISAFLEENFPPELEDIGREIVLRCRGVPLIIRTVGNILKDFGTKNLSHWKAFLKDHYNELTHTIEGGDATLEMLKLSFDRLPSHLKDCFAYCSLFPKDVEIDVKTLLKLWEAQGFMHGLSDQGQNLDEADVGYEQFLSLLDYNFFETVERDIWGKSTKCKLSVVMHDLATAVAGKECIKLGVDHDHNSFLDVPRHVSFDFPLSSARQVPTSFQASRLRSMLFTCQSSMKDEGSSNKVIFYAIASKMKFLRMLDLHDSGLEIVPDRIDELKHLRYLDLSRNVKIKVLPHSLTKLVNLQTLKLSLCFRLKELPRDVKNLVNLKHLEIDGCYNLTHMPPGLGELTQLETLSQFVLSKNARAVSRHNELNELSSLNNLRGELQIKNLQHDMDIASARLEEKRFLQSLELDWEIGTDSSGGHEALVTSLKPHKNLGELTLSGYRGDTLPIGPSSHDKLVKLVLRRCPNCRYLPPMHLFPSLKVLVLEEMTKLEFVSDSVKGDSDSSPAFLFFPLLQELRLTGLPLLRSWWRGVECCKDHIFPCLSKLFIEDCPELVSFPLFPSLEEGLVLDSCSLKPFQETIMMKTEDMKFQTSKKADEASSSTSGYARATSFLPPLSKLQNLSIVGIEELDNGKADGIMWENLRSLQYLRLDYLPSLESVPTGLQHITSLRELHIWRCSFSTLPEWITKLKFLRKLSIWICPDLKSLPENIGSLASLRTLEIEDSPTLLHRCQKKGGADWDKISRIPELRLDLTSRR